MGKGPGHLQHPCARPSDAGVDHRRSLTLRLGAQVTTMLAGPCRASSCIRRHRLLPWGGGGGSLLSPS